MHAVTHLARLARRTFGAAALFTLVALAAAAARAPAAGKPAAPPVQLIETRPVETPLGNPQVPTALEVWLDLIRGARRSIDMEQFYLSTWPKEPMEDVLAALGEAARRGVKLRLILDSGMYRTYPRAADSLAKVPGWQVRLINFGRVAGGIQHSKYFIVDGSIAVLGSQNFDWRALKHIHELGVVVRDARVARDFQQVFDLDWSVSAPPGQAPDTTRHEFVAPQHPIAGLPYTILESPADTVLLWPSYTPKRFIPDTTRWDLDQMVRNIDGARSEIVGQVLNYGTRDRGRQLPDLDAALRRAAARGVRVRLVVSDWVLGGGGTKELQELAKLPNVEIRISTLPEWSGGYIPFARVEHLKYMVMDTLVTWVGTDNWEPSYFLGTRNLAVTMRNRGLARQARAIFEASWVAPSAAPLDPNADYPRKAHGEEPPPGHTKYGG
jgi:phosphatidylserine/phosphatidylglycerophosphate/cardiolipin synthase-like enzyme